MAEKVGHHCHALGCTNRCPPRHLMCLACWDKVPRSLQTEVNNTFLLRAPTIDGSWAPWWRAQAKAIAHVAYLKEPNESARGRYLTREFAFAERLEKKQSEKNDKDANERVKMLLDEA